MREHRIMAAPRVTHTLLGEQERRRGRGDWTVGIRQSRVGRVGRGKSTTTIHQIVTSGEICNSEFLYSSSSSFFTVIRIVESHPLSLSLFSKQLCCLNIITRDVERKMNERINYIYAVFD